MSKDEIRKDIVGYEGLYKVSDRGNIYSLERIYANGRKRDALTLRPSHNNTGGYLSVDLYKNGIKKKEIGS